MAKRRKTRITKTKFASLRSVFPNDAMHAEIARLMVLYEDLKIEAFGITKKISALGQATDGTYSQRYFLRRSIATLNECGQCITRLDGMQDFKRIKEMMKKQQGLELWDDAVKVLSTKKPKWVIKEIRNDVGGHFGTTAGMRAIKTLKAGTMGKIEYEEDIKRGRGVSALRPQKWIGIGRRWQCRARKGTVEFSQEHKWRRPPGRCAFPRAHAIRVHRNCVWIG